MTRTSASALAFVLLGAALARTTLGWQPGETTLSARSVSERVTGPHCRPGVDNVQLMYELVCDPWSPPRRAPWRESVPAGLRCWYDTGRGDAWLRLARLPVERLSWRPQVFLYHRLLTPKQSRSFAGVMTAQKPPQDIIESNGVFTTSFNTSHYPLAETIRETINIVDGWNLLHESGYLVHYPLTLDHAEHNYRTTLGSAVLFIDGQPHGGTFVFPCLQVRVPPESGAALIWHTTRTSAHIDPVSSYCATCHIMSGNMTIALFHMLEPASQSPKRLR